MKTRNFRRKQRANSTVTALNNAQKIIFAPLTFQAIGTMMEVGILQSLDKTPQTIDEIITSLNLNEYTVRTLFEIAETTDIIEKLEDNKFKLTKTGECFLYDNMTKVNFNFIKDCCYLGASEMTQSFLQEKPMGLKKFFVDSDTIYPKLPILPEKFKKSWYEFDHYYSDNCFDIIYDIISKQKPDKIFDIGGNTGKFERVCLKNNPNIDITMLDLEENINVIKNSLSNCKFYPTDILDETLELPTFSGAILMSQFLDCFSKKQILSILTRLKNCSEPNTKIYTLEPFTDNQKFEGAKLALTHTSLYFTCMANGCSKMYTMDEMVNIISNSGLNLTNTYENIGAHDYTLLECTV